MARFEKNSLDQGEFLAINIGEQFDENTREYILKEFISARVQLNDFATKYKNEHKGRKIKNPQDVISAILYGYITGNRSSRLIEDLLSKHIGFMFVSNRLKIDHSVICEFKVKFQKNITELFSQLLFILNEMGSIEWDIVVGDGTKIKAYASKQKNVGKKSTQKILETYQKMSEKIVKRDLELEESFQNGTMDETKYGAEKNRITRQKKIYKSVLRQIDEYKKEIVMGKRTEEEYTNLTDPESKLMPGSNRTSFIQGYNLAMMVSNNDIILDYEPITTAEKQNTLEMVKRVEDKKTSLNVKNDTKYLFDCGFQEMEKTLALVDSGLDVYIDTKEKDFSNKSEKRRDFDLETESGQHFLTCRGGRKVKANYNKKLQSYSFRFIRKDCLECKFHRECYKNIKTASPQKIVIFREFELTNRNKINEYLNKLHSEEGQKVYSRRIGKEHVFSNIRTQKGYLQTVYHGRNKVNMELCWVSLGHNFMKYVKYKRP